MSTLASPPRLRQGDLDRTEAHIRRRTWGRVRSLAVAQADDGRVVIRGQAASYYAKQLAIQAAVEALAPSRAFDVLIEVR